ncbi:MAG: hypothetical protein R3F59_20280 [Myxococcota bacterium]
MELDQVRAQGVPGLVGNARTVPGLTPMRSAASAGARPRRSTDRRPRAGAA